MLRYLLLWLGVGKALLACSCGPSAPACQLIGTTPIVFLGTVIEAMPDPMMPLVTSVRIYRFRIDRGYKGLAKDRKEIVIDPENATSCSTSYNVGKQYLIFAQSWHIANPNAETYQAGECSGSRLAEWAAKDIEFLESYSRDESTTRVYGSTLQWLGFFGHTTEDERVPTPGARVTLRSASTSWERLSGPDGAYSFEGLEPGKYTISARHDLFSPNREPRPIEVSARGCVEQMFELVSDAELSGMLLNDRGQPAGKTSVELRRKSRSLGFSTYADASGHFKFEKIPTGDYILGYELRGDGPSFRSAVPTTYFPGTSDQTKASVLHLDPNQKIGNLTFRLQPPQTPRRITVEVVWPDGKAPGDHLLQISVGDELLGNLGGHLPRVPLYAAKSNKAGTLTFTGYRERQYRISARYWVDDLGGPVPHDQQRLSTTDVAVIEPGRSPITIRIVLGEPKLAEE